MRIQHITPTPWAFIGTFLLAFFLSATFLHIIDFVPEAPKEEKETVSAHSEHVEVPMRIKIARIGVDTIIKNPESVSLEVLDEALLAGAVRYPGSALLGEHAPMFVFGHQSYLPVVRNQAFKAFNDLQKLESGDTITIFSETAEYEYQVRSVKKVLAEDALIPLATDERVLVLSTCNSFGDPGERYIVEAVFVGKK